MWSLRHVRVTNRRPEHRQARSRRRINTSRRHCDAGDADRERFPGASQHAKAAPALAIGYDDACREPAASLASGERSAPDRRCVNAEREALAERRWRPERSRHVLLLARQGRHSQGSASTRRRKIRLAVSGAEWASWELPSVRRAASIQIWVISRIPRGAGARKAEHRAQGPCAGTCSPHPRARSDTTQPRHARHRRAVRQFERELD
jgi:hypothetical protein